MIPFLKIVYLQRVRISIVTLRLIKINGLACFCRLINGIDQFDAFRTDGGKNLGRTIVAHCKDHILNDVSVTVQLLRLKLCRLTVALALALKHHFFLVILVHVINGIFHFPRFDHVGISFNGAFGTVQHDLG